MWQYTLTSLSAEAQSTRYCTVSERTVNRAQPAEADRVKSTNMRRLPLPTQLHTKGQ